MTGRQGSSRYRISSSRTAGSPDRAHFYSERCYLAQATLGRLLEIYEDKNTRGGESPLTKFIKDLLGLDHLDSLIDGLFDAGDVRRFRTTVPVYWEIRESIPALEKTIGNDVAERTGLDDEIANLNDRLRVGLAGLGIPPAPDTSEQDLTRLLESNPEEVELLQLARLLREIIATRDQWHSIESTVNADERNNAERAMAHANAALETWRSSTGGELEGLFADLSSFFADLPSPLSAGPQRARAAAVKELDAELQRCLMVLTRDAQDTMRLETLDQSIARARTRAAALDEQIAGHAAEAGSLAQALAGILPHIHSENCPVCGRDFNETSIQPLQAHVSNRITALTESAGLLQALTRERADASRALSNAERERAVVEGRQLPPTARDDLKSRRARLEELSRSLTEIAPASATGERLLAEAAAASMRLNELRSRDQTATTIRESTIRFAGHLDLESIGEAESLESALERFQANLVERDALLTVRQGTRRDALANLRERQKLTERRRAIEHSIVAEQQRLEGLKIAKDNADERIRQARELARRAREARSAIVRRVFNNSLNALWRDLFVRLAPDEPFVPAFAIPEAQSGPVQAVLETLYRTGGKGGNPRAMLSAGNLNTAALTLFLALHLSVAPMLPWLVIDDPVQSMDEVHVAQFAALLRTLSKQHGRQLIIAVHEKPLFDYLTLELSPAFPDDRLITIEMGRTASGTTVVNYEPVIWRPDTAVAA